MKKYIVLAWVCLALTDVMAQKQKVVEKVVDSNEPDNIKGIIFTGDTMLAGGHGKTSLPGGNEEDMIKSLQRLKDIDGNYLIYPGHKEITTLKKERQ